MSHMEMMSWFALAPLAVFALIALLVYAPSWVRGPKYRPGLQWWAAPAWIGGGDLEKVADVEPVAEGGGCSASW